MDIKLEHTWDDVCVLPRFFFCFQLQTPWRLVSSALTGLWTGAQQQGQWLVQLALRAAVQFFVVNF